MPRKSKCCVGNCQNSRQDAILYKFPVGEKRLHVWLQCLSGACDITNLTPGVSVVCSKHFETRFITTKSRLVSDAYPSLFTDDEIASGSSSRKEDNTASLAEHSYARKRHYDHTYAKVDNNDTKGSEEPSCSGIMPQEVNVSDLLQVVPDKNQPQIDNVSDPVKPSTQKQHKTRQRIINKMSELTPLRRKIYKEYKKAKAQLSFQKRAKRALKFCRESSFDKLTEKLNPYAKKFLEMQIRLCKKNKNARRFTTDEKIIGLSIMKQSPKCYKFLSKIFILPSKSTLNAMIAKLIIEPGINAQVFNLLKKEVDNWDPKKKICSIIFDEMSLETALVYDKYKDCINGFVELLEKKPEFADHALVFMLRGAVYKWQQPICFYFCQGATSATEIKTILRQLVNSLVKLGLNPIALICDQGSAFQSALNSFKEDTKRNQILQNQNSDGTVTISGMNLNIVYDPPHLIKGLRNNFLTKNIVLDGKISKWQDIIDVYETDCQHTESRMLHKLNDQCVMPDKIKKMKDKNCVRVLSRTMSAALSYTSNFATYVDGRPVSTTLKNTAASFFF